MINITTGTWKWDENGIRNRMEAYLTATGIKALVMDHFDVPLIKKVIFNDPATIIIWSDKSKTVVKCMEGDTWDPEKGFMAAYLTKILGQKRFHSELKKHVKPQVEMETNSTINGMSVEKILECIRGAFNGKTLFEKKDDGLFEKKEDK